MKNTTCIGILVLALEVHCAHLRASRRTNEHATLGELYEELTELGDKLFEVNAGKTGDVNTGMDCQFQGLCNFDAAPLLQFVRDWIGIARAELTLPADDDLANILADIGTALNRAAYKLEVKP